MTPITTNDVNETTESSSGTPSSHSTNNSNQEQHQSATCIKSTLKEELLVDGTSSGLKTKSEHANDDTVKQTQQKKQNTQTTGQDQKTYVGTTILLTGCSEVTVNLKEEAPQKASMTAHPTTTHRPQKKEYTYFPTHHNPKTRTTNDIIQFESDVTKEAHTHAKTFAELVLNRAIIADVDVEMEKLSFNDVRECFYFTRDKPALEVVLLEETVEREKPSEWSGPEVDMHTTLHVANKAAKSNTLQYREIIDKLNHLAKHRGMEEMTSKCYSNEILGLEMVKRAFYEQDDHVASDGYNVFTPCRETEKTQWMERMEQEAKQYSLGRDVRIFHADVNSGVEQEFVAVQRILQPVEAITSTLGDQITHNFVGVGIFRQGQEGESPWVQCQIEKPVVVPSNVPHDHKDYIDTVNSHKCTVADEKKTDLMARIHGLEALMPQGFKVAMLRLIELMDIETSVNREFRTTVLTAVINIMMYLRLGARYGRMRIDDQYFTKLCKVAGSLFDLLYYTDSAINGGRYSLRKSNVPLAIHCIWELLSLIESSEGANEDGHCAHCLSATSLAHLCIKKGLLEAHAWMRAVTIGDTLTRSMQYGLETGVRREGRVGIHVHREQLMTAERWSIHLLNMRSKQRRAFAMSSALTYDIRAQNNNWLYNRMITQYAPPRELATHKTSPYRCAICHLPGKMWPVMIHESDVQFNITHV